MGIDDASGTPGMAHQQLEPHAGLVRLVEEQITFPTYQDIARSVQQIVARYDLRVNGAPPSPLNPYGVKPRDPNGWVDIWHLRRDVPYGNEALRALEGAGVMIINSSGGQGEPTVATLDRSALARYLD